MSDATPDPKQKLTATTDPRGAGLDDWRQVLTGIRARFRTGDFATGVALVDRIGAAAEEADHHPDVSLTYPEVIVTLSSHDVGGITSRDLDLARRISGFAAEAGADGRHGRAHRARAGPRHHGTASGSVPSTPRCWAARCEQGEPVDPSGQVPGLWFQSPGETGEAPPCRRRSPSSAGTSTSGCPTTRASVACRRCSTPAARSSATPRRRRFWVVEDADGNRSCICTPLDR